MLASFCGVGVLGQSDDAWTEYAVRSKDILGVILWNVPKPVRHHPESLRTRKKACARAF